MSEQGLDNVLGLGGVRIYRMLRDLAGEILACDSLETMLERCITIIQELLPVHACSIMLLDHRAQALVPMMTMAAGHYNAGTPLPLSLVGGRIAEAIKDGRPLIISHNALIDGASPFPLAETQSLLTAMLIPLPVHRGMSGILWLGRIHGAPFTTEERELAKVVASMAALAIRSNHTERRLQEAARRDYLTGLLNHGAFQDSLSRKLRANTPCALLLMDFDYFKRFNDTFGHQAGDGLLREAGQILRDELRLDDEAFRYGGEELTVILPESDREGASDVAERLRARCAAIRVGDGALRVTLSVGIAVAPDDATEKGTLIALADAALYEAKRGGRDRVAQAQVIAAGIRETVEALIPGALANYGAESAVAALREQVAWLVAESERRHLSADLIREVVIGLARAILEHDPYKRGHAESVSRFAVMIGRQLDLPAHDIDLLELAGRLHDIGKIGIPKHLLLQAGPLTADDRAILHHHAEMGVRILEPLRTLEPILPAVRHHHERFDGDGYPAGLAAEAIPLSARILAVADAFEAMTSARPHRPARPIAAALQELRDLSGVQFCPSSVNAFIHAYTTLLG